MKRLLISFLICLSILFIVLQFMELKLYAYGVRASMLVGLTVLYLLAVPKKRIFFLLFLLFFTIAEMINFTSRFADVKEGVLTEWIYYTGNILCIMSYIFLIIQVIQSMNFKEIINRYLFHVITLLVLDVFCVWIVSATTENSLTFNQYALEFTYNSVIMVLLSSALINYLHRDDKKSMNLLVGTIFIVFAEVIQLAYFYVADFNILNVIYSIFLVFAFLFFYLQSTLSHEMQQHYGTPEVQEVEI